MLYILLLCLIFIISLCAVSLGFLKNRRVDKYSQIKLLMVYVTGYVLTLGIVAVVYSLLVLAFTGQVTTAHRLGHKDILLLLLPTICIALAFHPLEQFVHRCARRLFYEDASDTREVLDALSDVFLTDNDIDSIMQRSLSILHRSLHTNSAYMAVLNASGIIYHHRSVGRETPGEITALIPWLPRLKSGLFDTAENPNGHLAKLMAKDNAKLLLRLGSVKTPVGMLLLGTKENGATYAKQDVALLQTAAKNMAVALDNAKKYEQILHFADTLHKELTRETSSLRRANKRLKNLDTLKDDFITTASHQLRTPAASVHDALHMLNHPSLTPKDRAELINLAEASSEHLVNVVRTMLNMGRLQSGHFTIDKSNADLIGLTEKVIEQVQILAKQKEITIRLIKPDHPIATRVDAAKINEALSNYIENAIKYSPEHSTVTVSLLESSGEIIFEVADRGMGVPAKEQKNLFQKFYRASNARQEEPDGNGIGLYVVKNIAEGHGGRAYYRSIEGSGSLFGFTVAIDGLPAVK